MQKLMLLALACALLGCSDGKPSSAGTRDAGDDETTTDSGAPSEDDAGTETKSGLERPPGSLSRPPTSNRLPDDLKPPGFAK